MSAWTRLDEEIARRAGGERPLEFWWRDDDAGQPNPALERLLALQAASGVPLALAVIPARADASLLATLGESVCVIQHGTDHVNRAVAGEKKSEFPESETPRDALARLVQGRNRLQSAGRFVPVLAPPWNRISQKLLPRLREAGFIGLSRFGPCTAMVPGLLQVNTQVDIIDWRGSRGFIGEEAAIGAALTCLAQDQPVGWLTHHAVHDAAAWDFLARLFEHTRGVAGIGWRRARDIFHIN